MNARQLACVGAAAFVGTMLVTATATMAKPVRPVVISKRIDPMVRYVSYADLSLTTADSRNVLYKRVGNAVSEVCPVNLRSNDADNVSAYKFGYCRDTAWQGALPQIDRAIHAAKLGAPLVMTIGVIGAQK